MAKSKAEICNLAVSWLGGQHIFSIEDDQSMEARLCRANYDMSRTALLEEREWTFAIERRLLTPLVETPLFEFNYAFQIPSDSQKILGVYHTKNSYGKLIPVKHRVEGNVIYADIQQVFIRYTIDLTNTKRFSALFDQALAAHIATNIAVALTENAGMQEQMATLYEIKLEKAISSDSLQGSNEKLETSQLEHVRRLHTRPQ